MGRLPQAGGTEALRESRAYTATLESISGKLRTNRVGGTSILEITATLHQSAGGARPRQHRGRGLSRHNRANRNARITEARKFIEGQLQGGRVPRPPRRGRGVGVP